MTRQTAASIMIKICKYCGKQYNGDPGSSACPDCADKVKRNIWLPRICTICGVEYIGAPASKYCPPCRSDVRRKADRERKHRAPSRPLGSTDLCLVCGKSYTVEGGGQKYCKDCAAAAIRAKDREKSRAWNRSYTTPEQRKTVRDTASATIPCAVCGKPFVPSDASVTCSKSCSAALAKQRSLAWERDHAQDRNAYHRQQRADRISAMSPDELSAYRDRVNSVARKKYRERKSKNEE